MEEKKDGVLNETAITETAIETAAETANAPQTETEPKVQEEKSVSFGNRVKTYFKTLPKRYFITAFSGMAQGLFVTLIAGTILGQIAEWLGGKSSYYGYLLLMIANVAKSLMGAGIGVGIAHALGKNKLLIFSAAVAGMVGAFADVMLTPVGGERFATLALGKPGNPIGAYVVTMFVVEIVALYAGKTKLDIILIPLGGLFLALVGIHIAFPFIWLVNQLGVLIAFATEATPLVMGLIIAIVMGVLLTMPTSSAAIWVAIATPVLTNFAADSPEYQAMLLAGGAATVGCACHMVGFAVASFRENGVSGLISQGIGTSMLQIPNVMKKPIIMLPMILSSAILGPLSTCVFHLKCGTAGGGMGTSGLVGIFDLFKYTQGGVGVVGIFLLMLVLPALLNLLFSEFMRKKNWIKFGDMKLDV